MSERIIRASTAPWLAAVALAASLAGGGCSRATAVSLRIEPEEELGQQLREAAGAAEADAGEVEEADGPATADAWGNLTGKFVFEGQAPTPAPLAITKDEQVCGKHQLVDEALLVGDGEALENVVIFLADKKKVAIHPDYEAGADGPIRFDNDHCRFEPHILPMRTTQTLEIHNSDPVSHNSNLTPLGDAPFNQLISQDKAVAYQFGKQQNAPVTVTCSIHPWMKGYVFPRDNPYVAVTKKDGTFEINNIPVGKHDFQVWQEAVGALAAQPDWKKGKFKLEIKEGDNDLGTIQVSASLFGK
jgi:hypothetical protein